MKHQTINKQFYQFVLPAMLTMLLTSFYTIVDGFFVGRATQDIGLAAIGLIWPIAAVLIALGAGIGTGGSVLMSACAGAGYDEEATRIKGQTCSLLMLSSLLMTGLLVIFCPTLVRLLGAKNEIYTASMEYIQVIAWGGSMQILASGLIPIIRNSHLSVQAMVIMGVGLISNIFLDALFTMVLPWGLRGAAIATTISQGITVVLSLIYLLKRTSPLSWAALKPRSSDVRQIIAIGISPFGLSLMPSFVTIFSNWQCINYGGATAVSAYSVINYFVACVSMLLSGIGEGLQPLISYHHGASNQLQINQLKRKALFFSLIISTLFFALSFSSGAVLADLFSTSDLTKQLVSRALPMFGLAFWFMGIVRLYSSYFYARKNPLYSNLLVYLDPMIFTPLSLLLLPLLFHLDGVWLALFSGQLLTTILLVFLLFQQRRRLQS